MKNVSNKLWKIKSDGRVFHYSYDENKDLLFSSPIPTEDEIKLYYETEFNYGWYEKRKILKRIQGWHRWSVVKRILKSLTKGKNLLDIGSGHGWFLKAARKNYSVSGLDYPSLATEHAKKELGLRVYEGSYDLVDLKENTYDIITMWHTLEHVIDPKRLLNKVHSWLNHEGLLLIAVPNLKAKGLMRKGVDWVWLQQPFVHLWHYSPKALKDLLEANNFTVLQTLTRDTWDAQYLYDGIFQNKFENIYIPIIVKIISRPYSFFVKNNKLKKFKDTLAFHLNEGSRILFYLPYIISNFLFKPKLKGSELIIVARKLPSN